MSAEASPQPRFAPALVRVVAGAAIAANALLFVVKAPGAFRLSTYLFALWLMLAWLGALALAWWRYVPGLLAGVIVAAALELAVFYVTFLGPHGGSTALAFAMKPIWQVAVIAVAIAIARAMRRKA